MCSLIVCSISLYCYVRIKRVYYRENKDSYNNNYRKYVQYIQGLTIIYRLHECNIIIGYLNMILHIAINSKYVIFC